MVAPGGRVLVRHILVLLPGSAGDCSICSTVSKELESPFMLEKTRLLLKDIIHHSFHTACMHVMFLNHTEPRGHGSGLPRAILCFCDLHGIMHLCCGLLSKLSVVWSLSCFQKFRSSQEEWRTLPQFIPLCCAC